LLNLDRLERKLNSTKNAGTRIGAYEVVAQVGVGGPASVRARMTRELRRGLADAQSKPRS